MAKNNPLTICNIKQRPNKDPKFHKVEILEGLGKSIKELLTILNKLCVFKRGIKITRLGHIRVPDLAKS